MKLTFGAIFIRKNKNHIDPTITYPTNAIKEGEILWQVYYDTMGNTLTVWFGAPHSGSLRDCSSEYLCEETGDKVISMKNQQGELIGFEKLNYNLAANTNLKISLETAIA